MKTLYKRLLQNKFQILVLSFSLVAFIGLYLADTYLENAPQLSEILRSVAVALLTSYAVGFVFEYITRNELSDLISHSVRDELKRFLSREQGADHLYTFWRSMLDEGLSIIVPEDESGVEPIVRVSDISASLSLYGGLIDKFGLPGEQENVSIEFIPKNNSNPDLRSYKKNLVIVGAPGANPLATSFMRSLYRLAENAPRAQAGYIFTVDTSRPDKYLPSPFIASRGSDLPALLEMRKGKPAARYERIDPSHQDGVGRDACLLLAGTFVNHLGKTLNVLLIAGCSRFSTIDGIQFVLSNDQWAQSLPARHENATATVLEISISVARGRVVKVARPPHSV
jgi:hypothetical protein